MRKNQDSILLKPYDATSKEFTKPAPHEFQLKKTKREKKI